ncbi:hypothetical protein [Mucilaginibacter gilvus]|uniref:Uncharacterized protein n=1 Tax=Mucilaginibacter gilvus TaxID=2305909 RepID=A0A444MRA4_9SPHI|nr:hypothetical protein [Mucilaginibacter gilvus]RWY54148.1 hypothetical protein EPL05_08890 [Mucilaginibacter gilvus]
MENTQETQQLQQYLAEAVEMLDDLKPKLALFEKQRYFRFKAALENYLKLNDGLRRSWAEAGVTNGK